MYISRPARLVSCPLSLGHVSPTQSAKGQNMLRKTLIAAAASAALVLFAAVPAAADPASDSVARRAACAAVGGNFTGPQSANNQNQLDSQRCTVTTTVTGAPVPSGTPKV